MNGLKKQQKKYLNFSMKKIRLAGVPEHFNLPWHLAYEEGLFEQVEVDLEFTDYPGGTGAMSKALLENETDLALLLTEGAVKFIAENPSYKIIKFYVNSPLLWGVHVPKKSKATNPEDLKGLPFAISRYGSGSHLMAYVYAQNKGLDVTSLGFEVIKNLAGLRESYEQGLDALFLWEKFTTKPFVEAGEMNRLDVCPTPWPCFVMVAHEEYLKENKETISDVVDAINLVVENFKNREGIEQEIAERYDLKLEDVKEWIKDTEWNSSLVIETNVLESVVDKLFELSLLKKKIPVSQLVSAITELKS